jgi:glycosyltransferase 2 family protein
MSESLRSLFGGFALSLVIPGRLGELGRCYFAVEPARARVALLNLLDRAFDEWALLSFALASLFFIVARPAAIFGVGVWLAALPVVLGLPTLIASLCAWPRWPEGARAQIAAATPDVTRVRTAPLALLSLASTFLELLLLFCLLRAFHPVEFSVALATYPWITMAAGVPLSLSGLGVREGAAAMLLPRYGIPPAAAVGVGLLMFALNALLPGALGGLWLLADRRRPRGSDEWRVTSDEREVRLQGTGFLSPESGVWSPKS